MKLSDKNRVIKNFLAITISFVFIFAAHHDIANVASVLNQNESLGTSSQA
jgi:hypothetical protein